MKNTTKTTFLIKIEEGVMRLSKHISRQIKLLQNPGVYVVRGQGKAQFLEFVG